MHIKTITPIKEKFNIYVISQGREQNIKIIQFTFIKFFFFKSKFDVNNPKTNKIHELKYCKSLLHKNLLEN